MNLKDLVIHSAQRAPSATAIKGPDETLTYGQLDALSNRVARALQELGVRRGDRVGIWFEKSARAVAVMQGVLRLGAAYVPVDPLSPSTRARSIAQDCELRTLVTSRSLAEETLADLPAVSCLTIDDPWRGLAWSDLTSFSPEPVEDIRVKDGELAYILYTSGSTGKPKGVCISQRNALAFVEWSAREVSATNEDRLSNHAPFHFDLSVHDLYVAFLAGGSVHVIPEGAAYSPRALVDFLRKERITIWYSVPSAITLMIEQGGFLDVQDLPLRALLFAGEPFPVKGVRSLRRRWPSLRLLNYYGPTETNVCTYYEVKDLSEDRTRPVPIGIASCGDRVWAVKPDGSTAAVGEEGELLVSGPTVMLGYWGRPSQGETYPTGDIVYQLPDGNYEYVGRRDHMVKVRGHRIELGEIEAALLTHAAIKEAAVVVSGSGIDARLVAFLVPADGSAVPSLLDVKKHCSERVPRYMIVDRVCPLHSLPRTRNGKVDRLTLAEKAAERPGGDS